MLLAAARGMLQLMFSEIPDVPAENEYTLTAEGEDAEQLLRAWLSELLYRLTVERSAPVGFDVEECTPRRIRVRVASASMDERMAQAATEIKAVTWHGLHVEQTADGWIGEVIFDT